MVIYLCKGYVIFSFLKSRWSDDIEEFLGYWQEATDTGSKQAGGMDAVLVRLVPYRLGTLETGTGSTGKNQNK